MQVQTDYARKVYKNHMAELTKLGELTVDMGARRFRARGYFEEV